MFIIKKIIAAVLALIMTMSVFTGCSQKEEDTVSEENEVVVTPMDYNYLTGMPFKEGQDKSARPVGIMINNAKIALPQYGLEAADIIYEAVTEGGITRLMALYSDINDIDRAGPVRSARTQFVQMMLPLNAIYVHIGSSTTAEAMLNAYSYQDIDGIYLGSLSFRYDSELAKTKASEHCWFTDRELIKAGIKKNDIRTKNSFYPAFDFVEYESEPRALNGAVANTLSYEYSDYADVSFSYNRETGRYEKTAFGTPHMDAGTGNQLDFDNVFLLLAEVGVEVQNGILPDFDYSKGTGYYLNRGVCEEITWKKGEPENPLLLYNDAGEILKVNTGKSYIGILGEDMKDTIVFSEEVHTVVDVERVQ